MLPSCGIHSHPCALTNDAGGQGQTRETLLTTKVLWDGKEGRKDGGEAGDWKIMIELGRTAQYSSSGL